MTDLAELQTAVREIPGVAHAVVRWPEPGGPATLRVEFLAGADRRNVTESIVRTMVDVGGVDLATMEVTSDPREQPREGRPIFTTLTIDRINDEVTAEVTLATVGRTHKGMVEGPVAGDNLELVARAAIAALNEVAESPAYRLGRVDRLGDPRGDDDQVTVQVRTGDDAPLLGAALVRGDAREAVVRAVLDATNRHIIRLPD